jgi:hypothetical protein
MPLLFFAYMRNWLVYLVYYATILWKLFFLESSRLSYTFRQRIYLFSVASQYPFLFGDAVWKVNAVKTVLLIGGIVASTHFRNYKIEFQTSI